MNNISFSIDALNDLEKIAYYIEEELHNHISGKKIVTKIIKSIKALKDFPNLGKPLKNVVKWILITSILFVVIIIYFIMSKLIILRLSELFIVIEILLKYYFKELS